MKFKLLILLLLPVLTLGAQGFNNYKVNGSKSTSLALGDFDKDGDIDVIGVDEGFFTGKTRLEWIENKKNGSKNLDAVTLLPGFSPIGEIISLDFDNDNDLDLIVSEKNANINLLINMGSLNFVKKDLKIPAMNILRVVDLDKDSDLDIVGFVNGSSELNIFVNDGQNNFSTSKLKPIDKSISSIDVADLNKDGLSDIVIGYKRYFDEQIVLLKNKGLNKYDTSNIVVNSFSDVNKVSLVDVNQDGLMDILACNSNDGIGAWMNKGNFNFAYKLLVKYTQTSGIGFTQFILTDLNGDGHPDIVTGNNSDGIQIHINKDKTNLIFETSSIAVNYPCYTLVSCNLDEDKDNDFFTSNGELWIFENNIVQLTNTDLTLTQENAGYKINNKIVSLLDEEFIQCKLTLVNTLGLELQRFEVFNGEIDLSNYPAANYILLAKNPKGKIQNYKIPLID